MDNGPEFVSKTLREWALVFIPPGQPWRNGFIESFNGRLRHECPSVNQFYSGLLRGFRTVVSVDFLCCEDVLLVSVVDLVGPLVAKR